MTSPRTEVLYKMYIETAESFLSRPLRHLSNLRMQSGLPGFRVEPLHFSLEPVLVNREEEKGQHMEVYEEEGENNQLQALVGTEEGRGKKGEYVSQNVGDDDDQIGVNKAGDHENYPAYSYVKRWEEVRRIVERRGKDNERKLTEGLGGERRSGTCQNEIRGDWEEGSTFVFGCKEGPLGIREDSPPDKNDLGISKQEGKEKECLRKPRPVYLSKEDVSHCREECRRDIEVWDVRDNERMKGLEYRGDREAGNLYFVEHLPDEEATD